MRVAALYDIHGNLPALAAVLEEVRAARVDRVVVGGDLLLGPLPVETLTALGELDLPVDFVQGNCDRDVVDAARGAASESLPEHVRACAKWVAEQLSPEDLGRVAEWPLTTTLHIAELGEVLFCHATPRNDLDIVTRTTPGAVVLSAFGGTSASVVVCGHTHMQFDRTVGARRIVNAGSVGMPFGGTGAYWLLIGPEIELRHTEYDLRAAAARIRASTYPDADQFADRFVLHSPSEQEMLEVFARAEMKH